MIKLTQFIADLTHSYVQLGYTLRYDYLAKLTGWIEAHALALLAAAVGLAIILMIRAVIRHKQSKVPCPKCKHTAKVTHLNVTIRDDFGRPVLHRDGQIDCANCGQHTFRIWGESQLNVRLVARAS